MSKGLLTSLSRVQCGSVTRQSASQPPPPQHDVDQQACAKQDESERKGGSIVASSASSRACESRSGRSPVGPAGHIHPHHDHAASSGTRGHENRAGMPGPVRGGPSGLRAYLVLAVPGGRGGGERHSRHLMPGGLLGMGDTSGAAVSGVPPATAASGAPARKPTTSPPAITASIRSMVRRSGLQSGQIPRTALAARAAYSGRRIILAYLRPQARLACGLQARGDAPRRRGPLPRNHRRKGTKASLKRLNDNNQFGGHAHTKASPAGRWKQVRGLARGYSVGKAIPGVVRSLFRRRAARGIGRGYPGRIRFRPVCRSAVRKADRRRLGSAHPASPIRAAGVPDAPAHTLTTRGALRAAA